MQLRKLRGWLLRLFGFFHRKQREREFADELESHLAFHIEDNLRAGMSPEEARRRALIKLGGVTQVQELYREQRGLPMLETLLQDLRFSWRMLRKQPGFTLVALLTLALGIGVNTALFTVYDAFVLKPLPLKDPDSLVNVRGFDREGKRKPMFSYQDYLDFRDRNTSFTGLIAMNSFAVPFGEEAADVGASLLPSNFGLGRLVSGNYFTVLNAEMALGRGFTPEEDQTPGTHPVLVLSHPFWERRFHSDPNVIGRTVRVAGLPFTIIGVTAKGFIGTQVDTPHFWIPLMMRDQVVSGWNYKVWLNDRKADSFGLIGRLKPGVTQAQAQAELNVITQQLANTDPDPNRKATVAVTPGGTFIQLEGSMKLLVAPLLTAVGLVLLIACVNVTNMLLARAAGRQREIAVRLALGANRLRIVRQLLTESILLAAAGGALGFLLATLAIRLLYPLVLARLPLPPVMLEQFALDLSPDYRLFAFAMCASLIAGVVAGLAPALQASRPNLSGALKDVGSTFGAQLSQSRLRNALVVMQIAVCLTLLIAAGLLMRNLQKLSTMDTGLITKNVFTITTEVSGTQGEPQRRREFSEALATRLRALPGVKTVSQAQNEPFSSPTRTRPMMIPGQTQPSGRPLEIGFNLVSADYFQTFGLRITRGRSFTAQEEQAAARVILISESTARRFWPKENALGKFIGIGGINSIGGATPQPNELAENFPQYEIIGLTNDTRQGLIWQPDDTFVYVPLPAARRSESLLLVSTAGDARAVMAAAYREARQLDASLAVTPRLVEDFLALQMSPFQSVALLAGVLGALALFLASIGLYGVMSFVVSQRTREIGIRMALGAQARDVIRLFLRQGGRLIAIGVALGLAGGAAISVLLAVILTDISQFDPLAFGAVAVFMTGVALLACWIPARRATKVNPLIALRYD